MAIDGTSGMGNRDSEIGNLELDDSQMSSSASLLAHAESRLTNINSRIAPLDSALAQLTRQFWVTKEQVKGNKYDLSASRYRQVDADAAYHEKPSVTLERMSRLEHAILVEIKELKNLIERSSS